VPLPAEKNREFVATLVDEPGTETTTRAMREGQC
jgi:hypothetical protein